MDTNLLPSFSNPATWAQAQWGEVRLGDSRRTRRAVAVGTAIAAQSAASLPKQTGTWGNLKAAYRLLNEDTVTHNSLCEPHWQATHVQAELASAPVVLFVQDTSTLDFSTHFALTGAGHTGPNNDGYGFQAHSCLAVIPDDSNPDIIGLAHQSVWSRQGEPKKFTEKRSARYGRRTEADVWAETLEAIGETPIDSTWISVGDRGSDIFSYVRRARILGWKVLLRAYKDRKIMCSDGKTSKMKVYARSLPSQTTKTVTQRGRIGQPKCTVVLQVAWSAVTLLPPGNHPIEKKSRPIPGWCIRCWNEDEKLEWILFTTVPVKQHGALEQISWYEQRWLIEEYYKCLKTGCAIEKRQLMTSGGLLAMFGFLAITAVRLLQLRGLARTTPEMKALAAGVEPLFLKLVAARLKQQPDHLTLAQFWRGVAMLGGFIGRRSDGEPGWQTLWDGWRRLQDMCLGAEWAMQEGSRCG